MILQANSIMFTGRVGVFNHNESNSSYKIFWLDGDDWRSGWCKGYVNPGCEIRPGDKVRLTGHWKVDQRHPSFVEQFFFSSYEVLSLDLVIEDSDDKSLQETEVGCIARITNRDGTARIFFLDASSGQRIQCVGRIMPGREILGEII
jgi:hypothetical protein